MLIRFGQNYFLSDTQQPRECCATGLFECEIDSDTTRNSLDTCLCPKMKLGLCLRAGIPLAFKPGPPQSLAASSGSSGLAGHAGCPGASCAAGHGSCRSRGVGQCLGICIRRRGRPIGKGRPRELAHEEMQTPSTEDRSSVTVAPVLSSVGGRGITSAHTRITDRPQPPR